MSTRETFRQNDLKRAIVVATEAGLKVERFMIRRDGSIQIDCARAVTDDADDPLGGIDLSR